MSAYKSWLDKITLAALCTLIFTLPFSKSAIEICSVIALVTWSLKKILPHKQLRQPAGLFQRISPGLNIPILLFVLTSFIAMCLSASIALSLKGFFFKLLQGIFLYLIVADVISDRKKLNIVLITMVLSMFIMGADGIFQSVFGRDFLRNNLIPGWENTCNDVMKGVRISASFINPNGFGGWIAVMIPIALGIMFIARKQLSEKIIRSIMSIIVFLLVLCLAMTRSRGAWAGLAFAMIFLALRKKSKMFLVIIVIVLATLFFILPHFIVTDQNLTGPSKVSSATGSYGIAVAYIKDFIFGIRDQAVQVMLRTDVVRTHLWREALMIIKDFPVFGCGLNTYSIIAPLYKSGLEEAGIYPHNCYLQMAAETGIVGLTAFLWLIFRLFKTSLKNLKKLKYEFYSNILIGLLAGMLAFLVHSFFDVNFYALQLAILMWFIMGLIVAVQRIALKEESNPGECNA